MPRAEKTLDRMRSKPRDWRITNLEAVAAAHGVNIRKPAASHVVFEHPAVAEAVSVWIAAMRERPADLTGGTAQTLSRSLAPRVTTFAEPTAFRLPAWSDNLRRSYGREDVYASAGSSRSRVSAVRRRRTPDASKMALARAAVRGRIELSPAPADGSSGWLICTMLIASVVSRIGEVVQSVLVTRAWSKAALR